MSSRETLCNCCPNNKKSIWMGGTTIKMRNLLGQRWTRVQGFGTDELPSSIHHTFIPFRVAIERITVATSTAIHCWSTGMPKELYMCQLCANHGHYNQPKKGHKRSCPNRNCTCSLCSLNAKRRALDQIERQWRHGNGKSGEDNTKHGPNMVRTTFEENNGPTVFHGPSTPAAANANHSFADLLTKIAQMEQTRAMMGVHQKHAFHSIEQLLAIGDGH